ncbi:MAG: TIM-barrel domain-containing protein [Candidatus Sumerlaeaceae bacterium]
MCPRPIQVWSILEDAHRISLEVASPKVLRLRIAQKPEHRKDLSYAVVRRNWPHSNYRLLQESGFVRLQTEELEVELRSQPFAMLVRDHVGRTLFQTAPRATRFDGESISFARRCVPGELSLGMGEVGETFDRSGGRYTLWNIDDFSRNPRQNFYCQIPFVIHVNPRNGRPFGLFVDNPGKQIWDLGFTHRTVHTYQTISGDAEVWLLFGDTLADILKEWVDLTGHMERPPLWALGYQQCRWSYYPESRVREIAAEFRRRKIPCDVLYLDIDYMDGYRVFTWHPTRFPTPEKLISDLREQGFKTVTIVDPGVKIDPNYEVYRDFIERKGFFCIDPQTSAPFVGTVWPGKVHFPDFTRSDVRKRWGDYQKKALLDKDVAGIWNDMNEPHIFEEKEFPGRVLQYDFGQQSPHSCVHQVYGLTMAQASHEGFVQARPDKRPFVITRSGWAGVQRHALMWTGDNQSTWASMTLDLQLNLSMGLTGISFVGCDIGGFAHDCYPELYARWIEWGVFQPFCRTHSAAGTAAQEPWSFGQEVEKVARAMIEFRMTLLPYLYTAFVQASETGIPVNRALVVDFPTDSNCQRIADEFLLGDSLLVAPVLEPAKDRRMVYLPAGNWVHWWTGKRFDGLAYYVVEAPSAQPPLFVRAGAVIPRQEVLQYVGEKTVDVTQLDIFPDEKITGMLVEDDGETTAYRNGEELRTAFDGTFDGTTLNFVIGRGRGKYVPPRKRWLVQIHSLNRKPKEVTVEGKRIPATWEDGVLRISIPVNPRAIALRVVY